MFSISAHWYVLRDAGNCDLLHMLQGLASGPPHEQSPQQNVLFQRVATSCWSRVVFMPSCIFKWLTREAASWECIKCPTIFLLIETQSDIFLWLSTALFTASCKVCAIQLKFETPHSAIAFAILCALCLSAKCTRSCYVPLLKHGFKSSAARCRCMRTGALLCMQ